MAEIKTKKSTKEATHPKYSEMVATAIETLKEKGGSSRVAIIKFITGKYTVSNPNVVNGQLKLALKKGVDNGVLIQVKGTGASGSFKLAKKAADKPKKVPKSPKKAVASMKKSKSPKIAAKRPKNIKSPKKVSRSLKKATKSPKSTKSPRKAMKPKPKTATAKTSKKAAKTKTKKAAIKKPTKK